MALRIDLSSWGKGTKSTAQVQLQDLISRHSRFLAIRPRLVDNPIVIPARSKSIPLPAAVLALSVAVCLGAAGPVDASLLRPGQATQAEQRETLEHLLDAIQQAAKKLTDQLAGQSALADSQGVNVLLDAVVVPHAAPGQYAPAIPSLREALLNLPPPAH